CRWHKASPRSSLTFHHPLLGRLCMTAVSGPKLDLDSERLAREYEELSATRQLESGKNLLARLGIAPAERVLESAPAPGCSPDTSPTSSARRGWGWVPGPWPM